MEKLLGMIQAVAFIVFGICFLFNWEWFANLIINQNVNQYSKHKGKLKIFFYLIAIVFLAGGLKLLFFEGK